MNAITGILLILETRNGRYWGFRFTDCATGRTVSGQISGGESNILAALTHDGENWRRDVYRVNKTIPERELFALPYAGCVPDEIRAWTRNALSPNPPATLEPMKTETPHSPCTGLIARVAIQCACPDTGEIGSFLYSGETPRAKGSRVTPVYADLAGLFAATRGQWAQVGHGLDCAYTFTARNT
jgi:hypothetical protein